MSKKNLIAGQSGGPTAAINSSLYGVVSEALKHTEEIDHVYGMVNGIEGFLNGTVLDFQEALPGEQLLALTWTPGAYLGSCRYKLPESLEDPVYPKLFQKFEEMNIGWFFYIGGNDSMDTVSKLSRYAEKIGSDIRILGEPKTIDNDLVNTDHTPGFGSAARYVASTVREITLDACVYEKNPSLSSRSWDVTQLAHRSCCPCPEIRWRQSASHLSSGNRFRCRRISPESSCCLREKLQRRSLCI